MHQEIAGFDKAADAYERGRPSYPCETLGYIAETKALAPGCIVVDLAAGTGKLTRDLVTFGAEVIAVEPLAEMRRRLVASAPGALVIAGTAEQTGLRNEVANAVTIAQAFHWFSSDAALAEIQRVLTRDGLLFLVWNRRDVSDRLQAAITRLTAPFVGEVPSYTTGRWREVMDSTSRFSFRGRHEWRSYQELDRQGLCDRVGSTSYIANLDKETRAELLGHVAELVPEGATVTLAYETTTYCYLRH